MPKNWKTYKLKEIASTNISTIKKDSSFDKILYLDTGSVTEGHFDLPIKLSITDAPSRAKRIVRDNDIIFSTVRPNQKHYGLIKKPLKNLIVSTGFCVITPNYFYVCSEFLYYYLTTDEMTDYLHTIAEGSTTTYPSIKPNILEELEIPLPPLPEQKAIANILSAIDDKIENNLAINKTLEEMAMALYKDWFVDFAPFQDGEFVDSELGKIPKGWEVKRLDEVAYKNSKTFDFKGKEKVVFVNTGDVQNGSFLHKNYSEIEDLPGQAKKIIEPNDILYSEIRPKNKRYAYVDFDSSEYVVSTKFMIIRNNEKIKNKLLYRILTRQHTIDEFQMIAESRSGTFPQITFDAIGHFPIILPDLEIQHKFQTIVEPFENEQSSNLKEIKYLIKLRDTLLPKLISGAIRLKAFQEKVKEYI